MEDELLLARRVGVSGARRESMPKVKGNNRGVLAVLLIPPAWRRFEAGFLLSQGAIVNMREKEKREAASATEFSVEDNHLEEKEKSMRQARAINCCTRFMVGLDRIVLLRIALNTASLSM